MYDLNGKRRGGSTEGATSHQSPSGRLTSNRSPVPEEILNHPNYLDRINGSEM